MDDKTLKEMEGELEAYIGLLKVKTRLWGMVADLVTELDQEARPGVGRMDDDDIYQLVHRTLSKVAKDSKQNGIRRPVDVQTSPEGIRADVDQQEADLSEVRTMVEKLRESFVKLEAACAERLDKLDNQAIVSHRNVEGAHRQIAALQVRFENADKLRFTQVSELDRKCTEQKAQHELLVKKMEERHQDYRSLNAEFSQLRTNLDNRPKPGVTVGEFHREGARLERERIFGLLRRMHGSDGGAPIAWITANTAENE